MNFLGLVPNTKIVYLMHEADVVIIPSRHEYPEGLPFTIYEALCSRTPVIASDHPMFRGKLQNNKSAVVFPAGNSEALADSIERLLSDADLYQQLSENSAEAWERLQIPVKFGDFLNHWLFDPPQTDFLYEYRLSSGRYE